ncbi:MAG: AAA family ATPase, partial [Gammaproteobacteria bacterium]|nr:AAA family ATPase [Gammaproteobacteria bacterium]
MKKKEIIKQIIRDFHLSEKFDVIPRDIELPVDSGKIITVIGVRRCGKTSLLYELINTLSDTIDKEQILYFNFEDERLNFQADELDLLLQAYSELYPQYDLARCYFFFDEIQNSLSEGGFSELIFINKEHALPVLQEYYNVLIYKDIVERYHVNNTVALKYF